MAKGENEGGMEGGRDNTLVESMKRRVSVVVTTKWDMITGLKSMSAPRTFSSHATCHQEWITSSSLVRSIRWFVLQTHQPILTWEV